MAAALWPPQLSAMAALALSLLWVLTVLVASAPMGPTGDREPARYEELTLLLHGALQLSQAFNTIYSSTEEQLTEATHNLGLLGRVLELLGLQISQGRNVTQELRTNLLEIQVGTEAGIPQGGQESR